MNPAGQDSPRRPVSAPELQVDASHATAQGIGRSLSWTAAGELIFAASFLGVLVALGHLGSARVLGAFTISRAVVLPAILMTNLHLRPVYVVEPPGRWTLGTLLALRTMSWPVWLAGVALVTWVAGYDAEVISMMGALALFCLAESLGDICIAAPQRAQQLRRFGISRAARGALMLTGVLLGLLAASDGVLGCWLGAIGTLAFTLAYDLATLGRFGGFRPRFDRRAVLALLRRTLPVGLGAGTLTLSQAIPAYVLEDTYGLDVVGRFGALISVIAMGGVVNVVVGNAAIPRLARLYRADIRAFLRMLSRLLGLVSLAHVAIVIALWLGGDLYLRAFGPDFAVLQRELLLTGLVGLVIGLTNLLSQAVTSTGAFVAQLATSASSVVVAFSLATVWLDDAPLLGALAVLAVVALFRAACFVVILSYRRRPLDAPPRGQSGVSSARDVHV